MPRANEGKGNKASAVNAYWTQQSTPLFDAMSDIDVLSKVFAVLGTPGSESNWPAAKKLPYFLQFTETKPLPLRQVFPSASGDALDLLGRMLQLDPLSRISSTEALRHPYFSNNPQPTPPALLPRPVKREDMPLLAPPGQGAGGAVAKGARERQSPAVSPRTAKVPRRGGVGSGAAPGSLDAVARSSPRTQH